MKSEQNVLLAKMEQKNRDLKEKNTQRLKQLNESKKETSRLKEILEQLRNENYISESEKDFLSVINFYFFKAQMYG